MATKATPSTVWDKHVGAEFAAKSADEAVVTMTAESYVNLIPLMVGARGRDQVRDFDLDPPSGRRDAGQEPVHADRLSEANNYFIDDSSLPNDPRDGNELDIRLTHTRRPLRWHQGDCRRAGSSRPKRA